MCKRILSVIMTGLLIICWALPVNAAKKEEREPVLISNAQEMLAFAESCRLNTYSQGLTVLLDGDIDLSRTDFFPVPIFSGTFEGNGHTISGLNVVGDGSVQGLFRYLTETAVVQNLTIKGTVTPDGSGGRVGAIAGSNAGLVLQCSFQGTVSGTDGVGGLVGVNTVTGIIENCTVQGTVYGNHFVGGIVGENNGVVRGCVNEARINATSQENSVALSDVTVENLTNTESSGTVTDIGGIAGTGNGVIRGCANHGVVGYQHMGYNIGGIAGTQSGYIYGCENTGRVYGRKEVGGIVGHMEPFSELKYSQDTLQILEGQLNRLSTLTNQAGSNAMANASSITGQLGELQTYTDTALDAIEVLRPNSGSDADSVTAAQNALSSSITGISGAMGQIGSAASGTASDLSRDLQAITNQINAMSKTINQASSNIGGTFRDISDQDTAKTLGGKVEACINYGEVLGDLNIGGIAGAMAMQNDLDAQDDWYVDGERSMNLTGEIRAVILSCENKGTVRGNKQNIGGIVGWQYMGLVKASLNIGAVEGAAADYVGGISGQSNGYIRSDHVKCKLSGEMYVGGISGSAGIVTDCRSMVEIREGKERIGAILGILQTAESEEKEPVRDNFYLVMERDLGGIDGISYTGQAEPRSIEDFVALKDIAEPLQTVTLRFVFEKGEPAEITVPLGSGISAEQIPPVPQKSGYVSEWEGLSDVDLNNVLFDMEFKPLYISRASVISGEQTRENGKPILLVQGVFTSDATVTLQPRVAGPQIGFGKILHEVWAVQVSEPETVEAVRFLLPEDADHEHVSMYVCDSDGNWQESAFTVDGSYAVMPYSGEEVAIAYARTPVVTYVVVVMLLGAVLLAWQYKDVIFKKK